MSLWNRIQSAFLAPVQVDHVIAWEDPFDVDAPMKVTHPTGECIAQLMAGGIHPPIDAHHQVPLMIWDEFGTVIHCTRVESHFHYGRLKGKFTEKVLDYSRCQNEVMGPLSYEQAIEYVLQKDVPSYVWAQSHNRPMFAIIKRSQLPKDRTMRNQWRLSECL